MSSHNLSEKYGGCVKGLKTYCRWLVHRPREIECHTLCTGDRFWPPCADYAICVRSTRGMAPVYVPKNSFE